MSSKKLEVARDAVTRLTAALASLGADTAVAVAFSGGLDSTLLLHAVTRLTRPARLRALHIDHALQPDSAEWAAQCRARAAELGVPFVERRIAVEREPAQSREDAARQARYAALGELLEPGEVLLTAHHADDQLETLLYRMFRGTGIRGLRGIAARENFGRGRILRPLLALTRAEIRAIADGWGLEWIEDPTNRDLRFDRNYVRDEIVPMVRQRWPAAAHAAQRLALAACDAEEILVAAARRDLERCGQADRLSAKRLSALSQARQRNVLRQAAWELGLDAPDARHLARLIEWLEASVPDPCVQWPGGEARWYGDHVYLLRGVRARPGPAGARLFAGRRIALDQGSVELAPATGDGIPGAWVDAGLEMIWRHGGERFRPVGARRERPLNEWFREHAIVPWMRARIPLLVHDGMIVAIADLALSEHAVRAHASGAKWRVIWHDRPCVS